MRIVARKPGRASSFVTPAQAVDAPPKEPRSAGETMTRWLAGVLAVVVFAGGLFGYDQGGISGARPGIKAAVSFSLLMFRAATGWAPLGALGGWAGGAGLWRWRGV